MPAFDDGEFMSYGNDTYDGVMAGDFLNVDGARCCACVTRPTSPPDLDIGELIPSMPCPAPPSLMTESLTLVPYGQSTLAIPTSMVTPELLAHLACMTSPQPPKPTTTDATDASHATAAPSDRLAQLGMELNALLTDAQRAMLNTLHRAARDDADPESAAVAAQRFWDLWYSAAPRDKVDELKTLMGGQGTHKQAPTPASATPATSVEVVKTSSGVSTRARHSDDDERDTAAGRKRKASVLEQMQSKIARLEQALASVGGQ